MYLPDTTTYSEFRENLATHIKRLKKSKRPTIITQNGKSAVVAMSPSAYEQLLTDAEESRSLSALRRAQQQAREGKGRPASQVFAELHADIDRLARKPKRRSSGRPSTNGHRRD